MLNVFDAFVVHDQSEEVTEHNTETKCADCERKTWRDAVVRAEIVDQCDQEQDCYASPVPECALLGAWVEIPESETDEEAGDDQFQEFGYIHLEGWPIVMIV